MKQIVTHEDSTLNNTSFSKVTFRTKKRNNKKKSKYIEGDSNFSNVCEEQYPSCSDSLENDHNSNISLANNNNNKDLPPEISHVGKDLIEINTPTRNVEKNLTETEIPPKKHKKRKSRINETDKAGDVLEDRDELPNYKSEKTNITRNDVTPETTCLFDCYQTEREDKIVYHSFGSSLPDKSKKKKKRKYEVEDGNYFNSNQSEYHINDNSKEINLCEDKTVKIFKASNENNHSKLNKNKFVKKNEFPYYCATDKQEIIIENDKPELSVVQLNKKEKKKLNLTSEMCSNEISCDLLHHHDIEKKHKTFHDDMWESPVVKQKKKRKRKHMILSDEKSLTITQSNWKDNPVEEKEMIVSNSHKYPSLEHTKNNKQISNNFNIMSNTVPPEKSPNSVLNKDKKLHEKNYNSDIALKKRKQKNSENEIVKTENSLLEKSLNYAKGIKKHSTKISSPKIKVVQNESITKNEKKNMHNILGNSDEQLNNRLKKKKKKKKNECNIDDMAQALLSKAIANMATSSGTEVYQSETENSTNSSKNMSQKLEKNHIHKVEHSISHKHIKHKSSSSKHSHIKNDIDKIQQALLSKALKNINLVPKPKTSIKEKLYFEKIKERQNESNKKTIKPKSKVENSRIVDLAKDKPHSKKKKKKKDKPEDSLEVMTSRLLSAALKEKTIQ